jgi:hypothetical protein
VRMSLGHNSATVRQPRQPALLDLGLLCQRLLCLRLLYFRLLYFRLLYFRLASRLALLESQAAFRRGSDRVPAMVAQRSVPV